MLIIASFPSLRLGRLALVPHPVLDYSVSLTGGHVAFSLKVGLESGIFWIEQQFPQNLLPQHSTEIEEMMEKSTSIGSMSMS